MAGDFEDTAGELLLTIDSQLDDVQGELEAVRALYQLRELINKDTKLVMKAHARHDLVALERFSQTLPAQVGKMGEALSLLEDDGIVESMKTIIDMCSQSASAVEQQSATTEEIAKNVNCIAAIAEHTAGSAVEASQRSDGLADLARRLQSQVSHFTIADGIEQKN